MVKKKKTGAFAQLRKIGSEWSKTIQIDGKPYQLHIVGSNSVIIMKHQQKRLHDKGFNAVIKKSPVAKVLRAAGQESRVKFVIYKRKR